MSQDEALKSTSIDDALEASKPKHEGVPDIQSGLTLRASHRGWAGTGLGGQRWDMPLLTQDELAGLNPRKSYLVMPKSAFHASDINGFPDPPDFYNTRVLRLYSQLHTSRY